MTITLLLPLLLFSPMAVSQTNLTPDSAQDIKNMEDTTQSKTSAKTPSKSAIPHKPKHAMPRMKKLRPKNEIQADQIVPFPANI